MSHLDRQSNQVTKIETVVTSSPSGTTGVEGLDTLQGFFTQIEKLQARTDTLKENVLVLSDKFNDSLTAVGTEDNEEITRELEQLMANNNKLAFSIKREMDQLRLENEQFKNSPVELRIRSVHQNILMIKFTEAMKDYQDVQNYYKEKQQATIARQAKIVFPNISNEEIEDILHSDKPENFLKTHQLLDISPMANLKLELQEISERSRDIMMIENSLRELHQMFVDLAFLVETQDEDIDNIVLNVRQATDYVERGNLELEQARKRHWRCRRTTWCLIITTIIVVVLVVIILLGVLGGVGVFAGR